jgi:hypothetical protein
MGEKVEKAESPDVQEMNGGSSLPAREPVSGVAAMRSLSNAALVREAARKALSAKELERTLEQFRELCATPGTDPRVLEETAEILREAGFKQELMNLLREALTLPGANPHVGALWMHRVVASKTWDHRYPRDLDSLCKRGEVGHRALLEFLELVGLKRRAQLVHEAIARHAKWLRKDPRGWAATGRALVHSRCYRQAARWMSGWRKQPELDLLTLRCLALALRAKGRIGEAQKIGSLALARPGTAERFPIFTLWSAEDEIFRGDDQAASASFKQVDTTGWEDDDLALYYLVRSVIRVKKAESANRKEAFAAARDRISGLFRKVPIYKRDVFLRGEYRRCLVRMAKDSGKWEQAVVATWRSADSWLFLFPLLVVPGLQFLVPCYLYRLCARRKGVNKRGIYGPAGFSSKW